MRNKKKEKKDPEKGKECGKESFYAKKCDVRNAYFAKQSFLVLLYKEACLSDNELNTSLPSVVVSLLQEFPNAISSGLPPIRGIEHQIDFIPGASIPNRPAYRSNPEETKELQRQVEELMGKGYIRESLSPCSVPVLLVLKKMDLGGCVLIAGQ